MVIDIVVDAPDFERCIAPKVSASIAKNHFRGVLWAELCRHEPAGTAEKTTRSVRQFAGHILP